MGGHDHDDHQHHNADPVDYVRRFFVNWQASDASFGTKVWTAVRNRAVAFPSLCCGHPGEPGC